MWPAVLSAARISLHGVSPEAKEAEDVVGARPAMAFFDWRVEPVARVFERLPEPLPIPHKVTEPSAEELSRCPTAQRNWDEAMCFLAEVFWPIVAAIFHH
jgi:hypothetical protein